MTLKDDSLKVLLYKRKEGVDAGLWSLLGSPIHADENEDQAAKRTLYAYTGKKSELITQLRVFSRKVPADEKMVMSVVYYVLMSEDKVSNLDESNYTFEWVDVNKMPKEMVDGHPGMIAETLKYVRYISRKEPIGFRLIPEKFTMKQMQLLYDLLFEVDTDKRNFQKKMYRMRFLEKLKEKDKDVSKKGAYLYRYNYEQYEIAQKEGYSFSI